MKFILVIGDGMADYPVQELEWRTPLQVATHPNMDEIMSKGTFGTLKTIPDKMESNTDVAILSILGYSPRKYYSGRGPLEAASMGVTLRDDDLAFRCNLVTERDGILKDYSAGHLETKEAKQLISLIDANVGNPSIRFFCGLGYRHLLVIDGSLYSDKVSCFAPHYVVGKEIDEVKVTPQTKRGIKTANLLNSLMLKSKGILSKHPINLERIREGKKPANMIWPWSPGKKPNLPTLKSRYKINGASISAVDVVSGIGIYAGLDVVKVPGATGYFDTNYEGKAEYAVKSLRDHDFVLVHVEAPDEAGHMGDSELKIRTIEDLDKRLLGTMIGKIQNDFTIGILADHITSVTDRNHSSDPVPFAIYSSRYKKKHQIRHFNEEAAKKGKKIRRGYTFLSFLINYCSR